ncbi:hypothetical protein F4860DRAFT_506072 [Xylaria cubensis]|nr:hypothetical protein F4860DRAFT_506072 [Xylaria cubensis]
MKIQIAVQCWGFIAVIGALAQDDNIPDLITDGPFALRPHLILHYDPSTAPVADDSYYRFYFNYTGRVQTEGHEVGLPCPCNINVALPALGASTGAVVDLTDQGNRAFLDCCIDDSLTVANKPANVSVDVLYYNWALC